MKKINFVNGTTIDGAQTFNDLQDNVEKVFNGEEAMGSIVVENVTCKNFFNKYGCLTEKAEYTTGTTTLLSNGRIKATANNASGSGPGQFLYLTPNKTYTISFDAVEFEVAGSGVMRMYEINADGSTSSLNLLTYSKIGKYDFDFTPKTTGKVWVSPCGITNVSSPGTLKYVIYDNIQVEPGKASAYVPYKNFEGRVDIITGQERPTNEYVDGKRVYVKRIYFGNLPNISEKTVAHGLTNFELENIIATFASYYRKIKLPITSPTSMASNIYIGLDNTNIIIITGSDYSTYSGYVKIYYTKTDTSTASTMSLEPDITEEKIIEKDYLEKEI